MTTQQHIVMNFATPPTLEDLKVIAGEILDCLPDELLEHTEKLELEIDDFPDEAAEQERDTQDPFDLPALYNNGKQLYPGVESKSDQQVARLTLYRRPMLDMWCETCDDLFLLMRQVIIEEIAHQLDFSDHDIEDMLGRHHQGLL